MGDIDGIFGKAALSCTDGIWRGIFVQRQTGGIIYTTYIIVYVNSRQLCKYSPIQPVKRQILRDDSDAYERARVYADKLYLQYCKNACRILDHSADIRSSRRISALALSGSAVLYCRNEAIRRVGTTVWIWH